MNKLKKVCLAMIASVMIIGNSVSALAAGGELHDWSFVRTENKGSYSYGHTHYVGNSEGNTVPVNCTVTVIKCVDHYICHCGATKEVPYNKELHSATW